MDKCKINSNLTEQFRPKRLSDLVGNPTSIKSFTKCVDTCKPCILHGPPGVGKTSSVFAYAKEKGYKVHELNASDQRRSEDMESIIRQVGSSLFVPTIFLLDEIDGAEDFTALENCVNNAKNPLVLICNDLYKVQRKSKKLTQICEVIKFNHPWVSQISKLIERIEKETGKKADYTNISNDVRNSILCAFYGGEKCPTSDDFKTVTNFFQKGDISQLNEKHLYWLLDNGHENFKGRKLYNFYKLLALVSVTGRFQPLKQFSEGKGQVQYPRYLKRSSIFKRSQKDA